MKLEEIIKGIKTGSRRALSRAISLVESDSETAQELLKRVTLPNHRSLRIGITGPPGAGKSTLVDRLIELFRQDGKRVAVISVDPTSPFTGGAILGDRVRMTRFHADEGVFIRSMATRGSSGGLARNSSRVADIFEATGFDIIIFETVGVGQVELDVVNETDLVLVVLVPESGDEIQIMKAGLMEIADIFIINKSDRQNAQQMATYIRSFLELVKDRRNWLPPVINTIASTGEGIKELYQQIQEYVSRAENSGFLREKRKQKLRVELERYIHTRVLEEFWNQNRQQLLESILQKVEDGKLNIYQAGEEFLKN